VQPKAEASLSHKPIQKPAIAQKTPEQKAEEQRLSILDQQEAEKQRMAHWEGHRTFG